MAEMTLTARSAFPNWTPVRSSNITIVVRDNLTLASISAFDGRLPEVMAAIKAAYGAELTARPARVTGNGIVFLWFGPNQWLALAERNNDRDLEAELKPILSGLAAVADQSDARGVMRISGPRARDVLAKGVPIDLHPREFKPNDAAVTHASHIGVLLWQLDDVPTYEIAMLRSFAESFSNWLVHSAAEFTAG